MSIRQMLLADAEKKIDTMAGRARRSVASIAKEGGVEPAELAKLLYGVKVESTRMAMKRQIADAEEKRLVAKYNKQSDIEEEENPAVVPAGTTA